MQHYHMYVSRVPGLLANGSPESEPGYTKTSLGERATYVPSAGLGDFYTSTHPPRVTQRWLMRDPRLIKATCETVDEAKTWYAGWVEENPRPGARFPKDDPNHETLPCYQRYEQRLAEHAPDGAALPLSGTQRRVAYAGVQLSAGQDVVDGFYTTGGEYLSATLIPCPPRVIPGSPEPPPCPQGRG